MEITVLESSEQNRVGVKETFGIKGNSNPKPQIPPNPKPKKPTFQKIVLEFVKEQKEFNVEIGSRLDTIDTRLVNLENRMTNVETTLKDHGETIGKLSQKLDRVITLNGLKS
ncbi:MAG: hypothetical protein LBS76_00340 [Mycoplasmataceae bacterium]|nr:hypothetical protein [Mycoplasmataceae bacterium]